MDHSGRDKRIYIQGYPDSGHGRRLLEAFCSFAHSQTPHWRVRMGSGIPLEELLRQKYAGIVFSTLSRDMLEQLKPSGMAAVQVGTTASVGEVPSVLPDHGAIGELGVTHFRERLFRSFAFVGNSTHLFSRERGHGFQSAVTSSETYHSFDLAQEGAATKRKLKTWLDALPRHTGILAASDHMALQVCNLCEELGLRVPGDRAVLGVDNDDLLILTSPVAFSSIDPGSAEIGRRAGEMLAALMDGKPLKRRALRIPPVGVVLRPSTDHLATDDEKVAAAARHMREEACDGLKVDEICRRIGLGRRMFEMRFHREIGRTPEAEMRRIRMEHARFLLQTTNKSVQDVAEEAGFRDSYYFSAAFKRANGLSPRAWRESHS